MKNIEHQQLIGKTVQEATEMAHPFRIRVVSENGKKQMVTLDIDVNRINVATKDGVISEVHECG